MSPQIRCRRRRFWVLIFLSPCFDARCTIVIATLGARVVYTSLKRTLNYCHLPLGLSMPSLLIRSCTSCPIGALCSARFVAFFVLEVWQSSLNHAKSDAQCLQFSRGRAIQFTPGLCFSGAS